MAKKDDPQDPFDELLGSEVLAVYALDGEERILIDEALEAIRNKALRGALVDFNLDVFSAKDSGLSTDRIIAAANTLPAFAKRRVVILKEADKLGAEDAEAIAAYLEDPTPTTVLIVVADRFDARTRLYKNLKKKGAVVRFDHPKEREMPGIIRQRAKALGIELEDSAIRALVTAVGADVGAAARALEKLYVYAGAERGVRITAAHVEDSVSHAREESIFALADAVGLGDIRAALTTLHGILQVSHAHPLALLGMLARHWRMLATARSLLDDGVRPHEARSAFPLPPFVADKLVEQAHRHSMSGLARGLSAIQEADQMLKGAHLDGTRVMERLVFGLTGRA